MESLLRVLSRPELPSEMAVPTKASLVSFPRDYAEYIRYFGYGYIDDYLTVLTPDSGRWNIRDHRETTSSAFLESERHYKEIGLSFAAPCALGEMLIWGRGDNGESCYWNTTNEEPNEWTVVVTDGQMVDWFEYDENMTSFLEGLLTRRLRCEAFPEDFPNDTHTFSRLPSYLSASATQSSTT